MERGTISTLHGVVFAILCPGPLWCTVRLSVPAFCPSRSRGIIGPHGTDAPPAADELAGPPGAHRPARKRSASRLLPALPQRGAAAVARPRLHRYLASDLRGPRLSLERYRDQRERHF